MKRHRKDVCSGLEGQDCFTNDRRNILNNPKEAQLLSTLTFTNTVTWVNLYLHLHVTPNVARRGQSHTIKAQ